MITNQSNKRAVESFVVNNDSGDSAVWYNTAGAGNALHNGSNVVLADGQLGIFAVSDAGTVANLAATDATPTIAEAPVISFYQGTNGSADLSSNPNAFPLWNRPYEKLGDIDGRQQVRARYQAYTAPTYDATVVGLQTTTGAINVLDNTEYTIRLGFRGRIMDEFYNPEGGASLTSSLTTPDFTTLGTVSPTDWIVQYQVWNLNRNSSVMTIDRPSMRGHYPLVAFALENAGTAGTAASALTPGYFPVVTTTTGTAGITLTAAHIASIQAALAAAGLPATTRVLTVDLATAGTATGGDADAFLIMALDRRLAWNDKVPQIKSRIDVGLTLGYDSDTVGLTKGSWAFEGQGTSRLLSLQYLSTQGQRKYNLEHTMDPVIEFPNPIVDGTTYNVWTIEHTDANQIDTSNVSVSPQKGLIVVPTSETTMGTAITVALNAFLASGTNGAVETV